MKSIKLKNNNYLDSTGIVHNKELLSNIIDNIKANHSDYKKDEDGTLICWGKTANYNINAFSEQDVDITLPAEYKDSNFFCHACLCNGGFGWGNGVEPLISPQSRTSIKIRIGNYVANSSAQNIAVSWFTIGKWK